MQRANYRVWNAQANANGAPSPVADVIGAEVITALGSVSAAATITLQVSADQSVWVDAGNQVLAGAGNFRIQVLDGAPYARLTCNNAVTVTAWITGKD